MSYIGTTWVSRSTSEAFNVVQEVNLESTSILRLRRKAGNMITSIALSSKQLEKEFEQRMKEER